MSTVAHTLPHVTHGYQLRTCTHFNHIHRIYRDSRLYQHLTGLGSPISAARRYLRDRHGINSGEIA